MSLRSKIAPNEYDFSFYIRHEEDRRMLKAANAKLQKESKVLKEKKKALLKVVALQQLEGAIPDMDGGIPSLTDAN